MNRLISSLSNVWMRIRRARAKMLARMYAQYKRKSSPIHLGERTIYFETYCPSIERVCDELGVIIPVLAPRVPSKTEQWFLSWRFRWPWPMRLASYRNKTLESISTTPDEMANVTQHIWDISRTKDLPQKETPHTIPINPAREQKLTQLEQEQPAARMKRRAVNLQPASRKTTVRPISVAYAPEAIKPPQESLAVVEGAIMDNSF